MNKENKQKERFLLGLLALCIRRVLDFDKNISISIEDYGFETERIKRRIIIDFPSIESCVNFVDKLESWKNAYKHRKR